MDKILENILIEQGKKARQAALELATVSSNLKNTALLAMAQALETKTEEIISENAKDLELGKQQGLTASLLERLTLNEARVKDMANGLREIAALPDPIGEVLNMWKRPNGLDIGRIRTPLGVIGIIYESRPNVTADAAALCLKSGNAILLRGGEEAMYSNRVIANILAASAIKTGIPEGAIQLIDSLDRDAVIFMLKMNNYLDVVIPRGGKGLKQVVIDNATVPYIMTGMGNCHVYVDEYADLNKALPIIINAKTQRPSVCNAIENLLVHKTVAPDFLPEIVLALQKAGVEVRGCEKTLQYVPSIIAATSEDWDEEYLELIISVKVVEDLNESIRHINT
ncbi:MAG: glutamate-5-semialdehyde dehydrogenase, partial [Syntrophomonadaceae bacterium]|nr:glutamate-5-semialdehyde dehydrogenase [Syntrophomonadaceae bacterium]